LKCKLSVPYRERIIRDKQAAGQSFSVSKTAERGNGTINEGMAEVMNWYRTVQVIIGEFDRNKWEVYLVIELRSQSWFNRLVFTYLF